MKVFEIGDISIWWAGETKEEAYADYLKSEHAGCVEPEVPLTEVREMTAKEMEEHEYSDDVTDENSPKRSFADELAIRVERGDKFPQFFAMGEP